MMEDCFVNIEVILDRMHEIDFKCSMDNFGVGTVHYPHYVAFHLISLS